MIAIRFLVAMIIVVVVINWNSNEISGNYLLFVQYLVSTVGLIVALVTTYFIAKIGIERSERVTRKGRIDELSIKLTAIRRISGYLNHEFWIGDNLIGAINNSYPNLTLKNFRKFNSDQLKQFHNSSKVDTQTANAYLSIKLIMGSDHDQLILDPSYRANYSVDEIWEIQDALHNIWSYTEEFNEHITIPGNDYFREKLMNQVRIVDLEKIKDLDARKLGLMFSEFASGPLMELLDLTTRNSRPLFKSFHDVVLDLMVSIGIILFSLYLVITEPVIKVQSVKILAGLTIFLFIDILINLYSITKKETKITEFYR